MLIKRINIRRQKISSHSHKRNAHRVVMDDHILKWNGRREVLKLYTTQQHFKLVWYTTEVVTIHMHLL